MPRGALLFTTVRVPLLRPTTHYVPLRKVPTPLSCRQSCKCMQGYIKGVRAFRRQSRRHHRAYTGPILACTSILLPARPKIVACASVWHGGKKGPLPRPFLRWAGTSKTRGRWGRSTWVLFWDLLLFLLSPECRSESGFLFTKMSGPYSGTTCRVRGCGSSRS